MFVLRSPLPVVAEGLLLDTLTATATGAWSLRKLRSAYTGPSSRWRATGGAGTEETDIGFSGNDFDSAALAAFLVTHGGVARLVDWYDQSLVGANTVSQPTAANQPEYSATGMNGKPMVVVNGFSVSDPFMFKTSYSHGSSTQFAVFTVMESKSENGSNRRIVSFGTAGTNDQTNAESLSVLVRHDGADGGRISGVYNNGTFSINLLANNTEARVAAVWNGTDLKMYVNGTLGAAADSVAVSGLSGNRLSFFTSAQGVDVGDWEGEISEIILFNSEPSSGDRGLIDASQAAYWV